MKKNAKHAFSLAEALMALLIVCLITLASVPVITKKKRSLNETSTGKYYCTLNSSGQHVHYSSLSPQGELNKPNTWQRTGTNSCQFVPPINAKIFSVTLIGGGGAGASGKSYYETVIGNNEKTGIVKEHVVKDSNQKYQLTMVGGGGGSGYHEPYSGTPTAGASAGGWINGIVTFPKNTKLVGEFVLPIAGGGKGGEVSWKNNPSIGTYSAGAKIYNVTSGSKKLAYEVTGGGQVRGRHCWDGWFTGDCGGGKPSAAGTANITSDAPHNGTLDSGRGATGSNHKSSLTYLWNTQVRSITEEWGWAKTKAGKGVEVPQLYTVNPTTHEYEFQTRGAGGHGTFKCRKPGETLIDGQYECGPGEGQEGFIGLSKIVQKSGTGGKSAFPVNILIHRMGSMTMTIGSGGTSTADGETMGEDTNIFVFDKTGRLERELSAPGAESGTNTATKLTAENGADSIWTQKGGGAAGTCYMTGGYVGAPIWGTRKVETGKCLKVLGKGDDFYKLCGNTTLTDVYKNTCYLDYFKEASRKAFFDYGVNQNGLIGFPIKTDDIDQSKAMEPVDSTKESIVNGTKSLYVYHFTLSLLSPHIYFSLWNCSKNKAIEAIKDKYPNTTVNDLKYEENFICSFKPENDDKEFNDAYIKISDAEDYIKEEDSKALFDLILNTKDTFQGYEGYKYKTYWSRIKNRNKPEDSNFQYECIQPEYKDESYIVDPAPYIPVHAECNDGDTGSSFGAGGGGGPASEQVGVFGYGGSGAPGAVIVEW